MVLRDTVRKCHVVCGGGQGGALETTHRLRKSVLGSGMKHFVVAIWILAFGHTWFVAQELKMGVIFSSVFSFSGGFCDQDQKIQLQIILPALVCGKLDF